MLDYEKRAKAEGFRLVAGIDEAGRGPLAGPVVASAVVLNKTNFKERIDDSKKLTALKRYRAYQEIRQKAIVGIGLASTKVIGQTNILEATIVAMKRAILNLLAQLEGFSLRQICFLVDGNKVPPFPYRCKGIVHGDTKSLSIASASIVAKVTRDEIMLYYDRSYSKFGFAYHKGYATKKHITALKKFGPSPIHRHNFRLFPK